MEIECGADVSVQNQEGDEERIFKKTRWFITIDSI